MRYPYLESDVPIAFPHRGGAGESAENTWTAFERVVAMGFRYIETDVQATSDGVALAVHDELVEHPSGGPTKIKIKIKTLTSTEIASVKLSDGRGIPVWMRYSPAGLSSVSTSTSSPGM